MKCPLVLRSTYTTFQSLPKSVVPLFKSNRNDGRTCRYYQGVGRRAGVYLTIDQLALSFQTLGQAVKFRCLFDRGEVGKWRPELAGPILEYGRRKEIPASRYHVSDYGSYYQRKFTDPTWVIRHLLSEMVALPGFEIFAERGY